MGQLVKHVGRSGVELDGYVAAASSTDTAGVLIHVHGLAGNFYENPFVHEFARVLPEHGITFIAANTRAHDYLADAVTADGDYLDRGAAHTPLEQTVEDLLTWIDYAQAHHGGPIVVQAHSAGAASALAAIIDAPTAVSGIVLLAAADMRHEVSSEHSEEDFARLQSEAKKLIADGNAEQLMPANAIPGYPIAADVFDQICDPDTGWGQFSFDHPDKLVTAIGNIPAIAIYGSEDPTAPPPVRESVERLTSRAAELGAHIRSVIVDGAGHSFRGHEAQLANTVLDWVQPVLAQAGSKMAVG